MAKTDQQITDFLDQLRAGNASASFFNDIGSHEDWAKTLTKEIHQDGHHTTSIIHTMMNYGAESLISASLQSLTLEELKKVLFKKILNLTPLDALMRAKTGNTFIALLNSCSNDQAKLNFIINVRINNPSGKVYSLPDVIAKMAKEAKEASLKTIVSYVLEGKAELNPEVWGPKLLKQLISPLKDEIASIKLVFSQNTGPEVEVAWKKAANIKQTPLYAISDDETKKAADELFNLATSIKAPLVSPDASADTTHAPLQTQEGDNTDQKLQEMSLKDLFQRYDSEYDKAPNAKIVTKLTKRIIKIHDSFECSSQFTDKSAQPSDQPKKEAVRDLVTNTEIAYCKENNDGNEESCPFTDYDLVRIEHHSESYKTAKSFVAASGTGDDSNHLYLISASNSWFSSYFSSQTFEVMKQSAESILSQTKYKKITIEGAGKESAYSLSLFIFLKQFQEQCKANSAYHDACGNIRGAHIEAHLIDPKFKEADVYKFALAAKYKDDLNIHLIHNKAPSDLLSLVPSRIFDMNTDEYNSGQPEEKTNSLEKVKQVLIGESQQSN